MAVRCLIPMPDGGLFHFIFLNIWYAVAGFVFGFGLRGLVTVMSRRRSSGRKMELEPAKPVVVSNDISWSEVCRLVSEAKKSVDVFVLHLSNVKMVGILLGLRQRGVEVRIVLHGKTTVEDPGVFWTVNAFWQAKIPVRTHDFIIGKEFSATGASERDFLVVDGEVAVTGTLDNWDSFYGFLNEKEKVVIIRAPEKVQGFQCCFQTLWDEREFHSLFDLYEY